MTSFDLSIDDSDNDSNYQANLSELSSSESEDEITPSRTNRPVFSSTPISPSNPDTTNSGTGASTQTDGSSASVLTRKRKRAPESWKRNRKSKTYNSGKTRCRNGQRRERRLGPRCECKRKECKLISDGERENILEKYWGLGQPILRQNYIVNHAVKKEKKRAKLNSKRGSPIAYSLMNTDGIRVNVCEKFFCNTLDISTRVVHYNIGKAQHGTRYKADYPAPANKMSDNAIQSVKNHIESLNRIESHYCRSSTKREYFEAGLSISKLYNMYSESEFNNSKIKESYYAKVFNENYNIGFHVPTKDSCDICSSFSKLSPDDITDELRASHAKHLQRKDTARRHKEQDKVATPGKIAVTFDLQQVLPAPRLFNGSSYYRRKLNCYNLTVYELHSQRGFCYTWHEGEGARGSNEISSCLVKYLKTVDEEGYQHVVLYSDTCGGQNRNRIFSTAIIHFLCSASHVKLIEHKYFESGHSQMECDSMHSAIEHSFKDREIDLPCGYLNHMKVARGKKAQQYNVSELMHEDFWDFKALNEKALKPDAFAGIINAHYLKYKKEDGEPTVAMSTDIEGEETAISYRRRGRQYSLNIVTRAYSGPLPVSKEKKADLLALIPHLASRQMGQLFYNSLRTE